MSRLLRLILATVVAFVVGAAITIGTTYGYDASAVARSGIRYAQPVEATPAQLGDAQEASISPSVEGRGTATTPALTVVATEAGGGLRVIGSGFSASERGAAEALAGQGRSVVLREASGVGRTSDLLVDGIPYDVYTPTTGNLDRIVSAIASKGSQVNGGGIVLDLSKSTLTGADQAALLARVQGVTSNISDIILLGG